MTTPDLNEARRLAQTMNEQRFYFGGNALAGNLVAAMADELERLRAQQVPTVEDINDQQWAGMDGTTAFLLIERHAEGWAHCGRLMEAWRAATAAPAQQAGQAPAVGPEQVREVLLELEWSGSGAACSYDRPEPYCPCCEEFKHDGHLKRCKLASLLASLPPHASKAPVQTKEPTHD